MSNKKYMNKLAEYSSTREFTEDDLYDFAKKVVAKFDDLSKGIAKEAVENNLNGEQVQRLIEMSNLGKFLRKYAEEKDKTFNFKLANYQDVSKYMGSLTPKPIKKEASYEPFSLGGESFEKLAENENNTKSHLSDKEFYKLKESVSKLEEDLKGKCASLEFRIEDSRRELKHNIKQSLMNKEATLSELSSAVSSLNHNEEFLSSELSKALENLNIDLDLGDSSKVVVNHEHPILKSMDKLAECVKEYKATKSTYKDIKETNKSLRKEALLGAALTGLSLASGAGTAAKKTLNAAKPYVKNVKSSFNKLG